MAINNQDKTEIHNLPEVTTLQPGMMVAVDSEPTGSKSFNLTTALESKASASEVTDLETAVAGKAEASDLTALATTVDGKAEASDLTALATTVEGKADASDVNTALEGKIDMPETTPEAGQVLTFDGSVNAPVWHTISEIPASTSADSGKVLKVGSTGTPSWGNEIFIATYNVTPFADILAAKNRGEIIMLLMPAPQNMHGPLLSLFNMTDTFAYFTTVAPGTTSSPSNLWTVEVSTDGTTDTWSSPIVNNCAQLGSMTIETDSSPVIITGLNNGFATMSLNRSSFTLIVKVNDGEVVNFAIEIENSQSCQLTIQKQVGNTTTALKHSVAAGNTLEANKTYQVTAVGTCWTLAEFET